MTFIKLLTFSLIASASLGYIIFNAFLNENFGVDVIAAELIFLISFGFSVSEGLEAEK